MLTRIKTLLPNRAKLTILDWIIIGSAGLILIVAGTFFFRKNTYKTITIKIGEENVLWTPVGPRKIYANLFKRGMKEMSGLGKTEAEILDVYSYDSGVNRKNVYLTLRINATFNKASKQYVFKGKPVAVGTFIRTYLGSVLTEGLITNVEGVEESRNKKTITVESRLINSSNVWPQTNGVEPFIADAVNIGDTIKDNRGNTRAVVVDKRVEDALQTTTTMNGEIRVVLNPLKKDVFLTVNIYGFEQNNNYFMFDDIPVLINTEIPLHFPTLDIQPVVTKVLRVE